MFGERMRKGEMQQIYKEAQRMRLQGGVRRLVSEGGGERGATDGEGG